MRKVQGLMGSCVMCAIQIHQSAGRQRTKKKKDRKREREIKKEERGILRTLKEMSVVGLGRSCAWLNSGQPLCTLLFPESMTLPKGEKTPFYHSVPFTPSLCLSNMPYVPISGRPAGLSSVTGPFSHCSQSHSVSGG